MKQTPMRRHGKRTKKSKGHLFPKLVDETYREWVRAQPCILAGGECSGRIQVCHVRSRGAGGPDHGNVVPMCARHHHLQHSMGIKTFAREYILDLVAEATWYYNEYERDYLTPFRGL